MIVYDANNNSTPLCFARSVEAESGGYWKKVFAAVKCISGFDVEQSMVMIDREKGIESAKAEVMGNDTLFADFVHLTKNMLPEMGEKKEYAENLYK